MKLQKNGNQTIFVLLLVLTLVSLCSYLYVYAPVSLHSQDSIEHWEKRISQVGPERAYDELKILVRSDVASDQHEKAHRFGAALFKVEGLPGIRICDDEFWFGCFHYFVAFAVLEHGLSAIPELMENCTSQAIPSYPCYHGVGHGIMIVNGYDVHGVETALSYCRDIPGDTQYHCMYGVFMEFNSANFLLDVSSSSTALRPQENPYGVCDSLENPSLPERMWCIASLPQWWTTRGDIDKEQQGEWCANLHVSDEKDACFQAIGKSTLFAEQPGPETTHTLCETASVGHRSYVLCVSGAVKLGFNHKELLGGSPERLCDMFEDIEDRKLCNLYTQPESGLWATFYE